MKPFFIFCFSLFVIATAVSQPQPNLHKTAKNLMKEGDFENATLVLNQLLTNEPDNKAAKKDLAYAYYLKRDYAKSIELSKKLIEDSACDEQDYQILGLNYKEIAMYKEANQMYRVAIEKFSNSGILYNEWADLNMLEKKPDAAIKNWEKGIEADPNYPGNYYNATLYYSQRNDLFWTAVYGEIFVNLESYTVRTAEIKDKVLEAYKTLCFARTVKPSANEFEKTATTLLASSSENPTAINLTAIRLKFILHWFYFDNNTKFPFRLFDQLRYLIREGMFDAYNQWLFGLAINPNQYKLWVEQNKPESSAFKQFQEGRVFKLIEGQYYKN